MERDTQFSTADARCERCGDTGVGDPYEVFDGSPPFTTCDACLGAGLDGCPACDGYGAVVQPVACPHCHETPVPLLAA